MGLCKCERRRVTTLFCFEHRVNVCEFCLVSSHEKCIVKSYLRWLKDSNFDPSCGICHERFDESDKKCVRLVCLDVFHRDCLNQLVLSAPPTTAPAGYVCPSCGHPIIPYINQGGPVAEALRNVLNDVDWAKCELTGPNGRSQPSLPNKFDASLPLNTSGYINGIATLTGNEKLLDPHLDRVARQFLSGQDVPVTEFRTPIVQADTSANYPPNHNLVFQPSPTALRRDAPINVNSVSAYPNRLDDEDKYKRRVAFSGLIRTFKSTVSRQCSPTHLRKRRTIIMILIVCLLGLFLFSNIHSRDFSDLTDVDPLLDPRLNPHIVVDHGAAAVVNHALADRRETQLKSAERLD